MTFKRLFLWLSSLVFLLGSCATEPTEEVVTEGTADRGHVEQAEEPEGATASVNGEGGDEKFQLLDPSGVTALPSDEDMRPTVPEHREDPVIARPPSEDE